MAKILNQFRRLYGDYGANDKDFSKDELRLKEAQDRLVNATNELVRSSDNLNAAAISASRSNRPIH